MTYKQIEASRELRLWIGQVIVPAVTEAVIRTLSMLWIQYSTAAISILTECRV